MARINLKKFIAEHYKGGVTARDVIREGVTNSIHAGAQAISVDLWFDRQPGLFGDEVRNVLDKITITDDGEGFTQDNLNYFDEIWPLVAVLAEGVPPNGSIRGGSEDGVVIALAGIVTKEEPGYGRPQPLDCWIVLKTTMPKLFEFDRWNLDGRFNDLQWCHA